MLLDPADGSVQQERLGFGILRKWNPAREQRTGGLQSKLSGNEEQGTDFYWRLSCVVDIPDQQSLGDKGMVVLGACPTLPLLLRRTIHGHLRRSRPRKILNVFQRIHLRVFWVCGLASDRTSFAS